MMKKGGGLVYSTDGGRMCPTCRQPLAQCRCKTAVPATSADGFVRVQRESKGRGGKTMTVARGFGLSDTDLTPIAKRLKAACGAGGTAKDGTIEVQGDHADKVVAWLQAEGWKVKRAGG